MQGQWIDDVSNCMKGINPVS